jgi:hypothetical protein
MEVEKKDDHHVHEHHDHAESGCCGDHDHGHHHEEEEEKMPGWKKAALDADPTAAPFGGSWNAESNVTATDAAAAAAKMEE